MTEDEWMAADDPADLLWYLTRPPKHRKPSERKVTYFACACCRRIWGLIPTEASSRAIELAERYADGMATSEERDTARAEVDTAGVRAGVLRILFDQPGFIDSERAPGTFAVLATQELVRVGRIRPDAVAWQAVSEMTAAANQGQYGARRCPETEASERKAQATFLRDIVGSPFRPMAVDPAWLAWNGGAVRRLAEMAYQERELPAGHLSPARLALVADALEDAGCDDVEILGHLRGLGPHVRGCWALDLLTERA
jgi:hypothetical protein